MQREALTPQHLASHWDRSVGTVLRWRKIAPNFPAPIRYNARTILWPIETIAAYEQTEECKDLLAHGTVRKPAAQAEVVE